MIDWLNEKLHERDLSQSRASLLAGLNGSAISEIMNGKQPGLRVCMGLAEFFGEPLTHVLYLAGHISKEEAEGRDARAERVLPLWQQLTPEQKETFEKFLRSIVDV